MTIVTGAFSVAALPATQIPVALRPSEKSKRYARDCSPGRLALTRRREPSRDTIGNRIVDFNCSRCALIQESRCLPLGGIGVRLISLPSFRASPAIVRL